MKQIFIDTDKEVKLQATILNSLTDFYVKGDYHYDLGHQLNQYKHWDFQNFVFRDFKKECDKLLKSYDIKRDIRNNLFGTIGSKLDEVKNADSYYIKFAKDKNIIGNEIYEDHETCFSDDGFNSFVKTEVLGINRRYQVLLVHDNKKVPYGRAILFFNGNGEIHIMNMYTITNASVKYKKELFREIIGQLFNRKVLNDFSYFKEHRFYQNAGNFNILLEARGVPNEDSKSITSPCCGRKIPYTKLKSFEDSDGKNHFYCGYGKCLNQMEREYGSRITCSCCENSMDEDNSYTDSDGNIICQSCYEENYFMCEDCNEIHNNDNVIRTIDNNYICQECYEENYFCCYECSEVFHNNDGNEINDRMYCDTCRDALFTVCECCEDLVKADTIEIVDNESFCSDCFNDKFFECCECGDTFDVSDKITFNDLSESFCSECVDLIVNPT